MKIAIGCDHAALDCKQTVMEYLEAIGHEVKDFGCYSRASCDYPAIARPVAEAIVRGECERGVLICGTGLGMSYAANKVRGIRAACVSEAVSAVYARQHNDAQIVCLGARIVGDEVAKQIARVFIDTEYSRDPRHQRRIDMLDCE